MKDLKTQPLWVLRWEPTPEPRYVLDGTYRLARLTDPPEQTIPALPGTYTEVMHYLNSHLPHWTYECAQHRKRGLDN